MDKHSKWSQTHLFSAQQSQQIDCYAAQSLQIPSLLLMKRAAWHASQLADKLYPDCTQIDILCGTGNNGGDGFAMAQYALLEGKEVTIWLYGDAQKIKNDALTTFNEVKALGIPVQSLSEYAPEENHLIIDALFGTGLDRPLSDDLQSLINLINRKKMPVIALDSPSGLDSNSGRVLGAAFKAQHTCSFITYKTGHFSLKGRDHCGQIHLFDLSVPEEAYRSIQQTVGMHGLDFWLNKRVKPDSSHHKGAAGINLLIGGNSQMQGALQIASEGCLHSGAGLTHTYSPQSGYFPEIPEIQCHSPENSQLENLISKAAAIAIGPGLGQDTWAQQSLQQLVQSAQHKTLLIDADALNLLAQKSDHELETIKYTLSEQHTNWILTPHPGEAARLLNCSTQEVQNNRIEAIKALQKRYGGTLVLKGNGSLIFNGKQCELCPNGNPGMAVGGMGDLLSGIICALAAQGMEAYSAACLGVYLHATAGDQAAKKYGEAGVTPSRMQQFIGRLLG